MLRIKLIVTGDMEKQGLHESLRRLFPAVRAGVDVTWEQPQKIQCVTSHRLVAGKDPSKPMLDMARAMLAAVGIGKTGNPADLVIVIDDLELENVGQEHVVAAHFRAAVLSQLQTYSMPVQQRYRSLLQDRCSFHLLKPLTEAYFFGDSNALQVAGVGAATIPQLVHASDVEAFESNDPIWLPLCTAENFKKQKDKPWWRHECHPKLYLEHLAKRGNADYDYSETRHGLNALVGLDWGRVPKQGTDTDVLRALFMDLADWFGTQSPLGNCAPNSLFYPSPHVRRASLLLRNM